nr:hypothetical protein [Candidatus Baldrarchaeota archaeon]
MAQNLTIGVFGPDGSGKSTQINLLTSYLESQGFKVYKTWICWNHLFAWMLCRIFVHLGCYVWKPSEKCPINKYPPIEVYRGKLGKHIWMFIELVSLLLMLFTRVFLKKIAGYIIVVERYIAGTLADLVYIHGEPILNSIISRFLLKTVNNNRTIFIYLTADYKTIVGRRRLMSEPKDYIEAQETAYRWFARHFNNCLVINTSKSTIEDTQKTIQDWIMQHIKVKSD